MSVDEYGLTPKQRAFADEFIRTGNAREAARKAGYKNPPQSAVDNTAKQSVKNYIAMRTRPTIEKRIADADEVLLYLSRVMRGELKDQFGLEISIQDRTKAAQELMRRYAVADQRQQSTLQRLDEIFIGFKAALGAPPPEATVELPATSSDAARPEGPAQAAPEATTQGTPPASDATTPTQGTQGTDAATQGTEAAAPPSAQGTAPRRPRRAQGTAQPQGDATPTT